MIAIMALIIINIVTPIVMVKRNKKALLLFYVRDFLPEVLIITSPILIVHYFGLDCFFCVICALTVIYLIQFCLEVKKGL